MESFQNASEGTTGNGSEQQYQGDNRSQESIHNDWLLLVLHLSIMTIPTTQ